MVGSLGEQLPEPCGLRAVDQQVTACSGDHCLGGVRERDSQVRQRLGDRFGEGRSQLDAGGPQDAQVIAGLLQLSPDPFR